MNAWYKTGSLWALSLLAIFAMTACNNSESSSQPGKAQNHIRTVHVAVVPVEPTVIRDILVLPGESEAWQDVRVAADTAGRIEWIGPKEGDPVEAGQLMAKIDVSALKASRDRAQANLELCDELCKRRLKLYERKIIPKEELDRSLTEKAVAESNLQQAKVEYERGFPRAPISGLVNYLFVDEGEFVDRGKPVADLVNIDKIKINVNIPELDVRYLKVGQPVSVRFDAFPEREMSGVIDFIGFKADPATKTFPVRVLVDNRDHHIRPGMIARVVFLRRIISDALVAPLFALIDRAGERMAYVEKDGVVQARTVGIGVIEGDRVQITRGLNVGDHLIVSGHTEVEEGMRVEVK
jgi:membrane fusion protein (multidrug efflux system)